MADGRAFHLPDLPHAGMATRRERELHDMVQEFMRQVERNRLRLVTIVLEGKTRWRQVAQQVWRGHRIGEDHQLLDAIFSYFELQTCPPAIQRQLLDHAQNPQKWAELVDEARPGLEREREGLRLMAKWS